MKPTEYELIVSDFSIRRRFMLSSKNDEILTFESMDEVKDFFERMADLMRTGCGAEIAIKWND